jgi:hypothetical protein
MDLSASGIPPAVLPSFVGKKAANLHPAKQGFLGPAGWFILNGCPVRTFD